MIFEKNPFTTADSMPKSFHLTPFSPTFEIHQPTLVLYGSCSGPLILMIQTRWTFFRVKLVFECEFEISWSLGPWDLRTPRPWYSWTSSLLHHLIILPLPSPISSSYSPPLIWVGMGEGGGAYFWYQIRC